MMQEIRVGGCSKKLAKYHLGVRVDFFSGIAQGFFVCLFVFIFLQRYTSSSADVYGEGVCVCLRNFLTGFQNLPWNS